MSIHSCTLISGRLYRRSKIASSHLLATTEILSQPQINLLVETAVKLVRTTPVAAFGSMPMAQDHARYLMELAGKPVMPLAMLQDGSIGIIYPAMYRRNQDIVSTKALL
jgi:hypothetical protein